MSDQFIIRLTHYPHHIPNAYIDRKNGLLAKKGAIIIGGAPTATIFTLEQAKRCVMRLVRRRIVTPLGVQIVLVPWPALQTFRFGKDWKP